MEERKCTGHAMCETSLRAPFRPPRNPLCRPGIVVHLPNVIEEHSTTRVRAGGSRHRSAAGMGGYGQPLEKARVRARVSAHTERWKSRARHGRSMAATATLRCNCGRPQKKNPALQTPGRRAGGGYPDHLSSRRPSALLGAQDA